MTVVILRIRLKGEAFGFLGFDLRRVHSKA